MWRFAALLVLVVALAVAVLSGATPSATTVADLAHRTGAFAPLVIVAGTALLLAAIVPRTALAAAAGLVFGAPQGALYVLTGALLGAVIAFGTGRMLGRDFIRSSVRGATVDRLLERRGLFAVLVLRLLPIAPFGLVSYAAGSHRRRRQGRRQGVQPAWQAVHLGRSRPVLASLPKPADALG